MTADEEVKAAFIMAGAKLADLQNQLDALLARLVKLEKLHNRPGHEL